MSAKFCLGTVILTCAVLGITGSRQPHVQRRDTEGQSSLPKFVFSKSKENFFQAFVNCHENGMELASIKSAEENEEMLSALGYNATNSGTNSGKEWQDGYWLSGNNLLNIQKADFSWLPSGEPFDYKNWQPKYEPSSGSARCVQWLTSEGKPGWIDQTCFFSLKYVCKRIDNGAASKMQSQSVIDATVAKLETMFIWTKSKLNTGLNWALTKGKSVISLVKGDNQNESKNDKESESTK